MPRGLIYFLDMPLDRAAWTTFGGGGEGITVTVTVDTVERVTREETLFSVVVFAMCPTWVLTLCNSFINDL